MVDHDQALDGHVENLIGLGQRLILGYSLDLNSSAK